jgi:hypothetical protein
MSITWRGHHPLENSGVPPTRLAANDTRLIASRSMIGYHNSRSL